MEISKLDAARRQLDTAIDLYFASGDEVAIHTLASAAYELVTTLRSQAGMADEIEEQIRPERRAEFRRLWNAEQNFFKHADRDADEVLEFTSSLTEIRMFTACQRYGSLGKSTEAMFAFVTWYSLHNVDLLLDSPFKTAIDATRHRWLKVSRDRFRQFIQETVSQTGQTP